MNFKNLTNYYIKHLENGYSEKSFDLCDYKKIEDYAQKENLMKKIELAKSSSQKLWESFAVIALSNNFKHFPYELWVFVMKSRFGWNPEPKPIVDEEPQEVEVRLMLNKDQIYPGSEDDSNEQKLINS